MKVGFLLVGFLSGVAALTVAIVANNAIRSARCAKQFNVYDCEIATVLVPGGLR